MSDNNTTTKAVAQQCNGRSQLARVKNRNQRWNSIKEDVYRIYIQEGRSLEVTMASIKLNFDFKECVRTWKSKLKEWGYYKNKKNIPYDAMNSIAGDYMKRKREGKESVFYYRHRQVDTETINTFLKRRKITQEPLGKAMHPDVTYYTPSPEFEIASSKEVCYQPRSHPSSISRSTGSSFGQASSIRSSPSEGEILEVTAFSRVDHWLDDFEDQPWCSFDLSHQRHIQETELTDFHTLPTESDYTLPGLSIEANSLPNLASIDDISHLNTYSAIEDEQLDVHSRTVALDSVAYRAAANTKYQELLLTYLRYQNEHGKTSELTFYKQLILAKALEKDGYYDEAEYHCRQLLETSPEISVRCLLGLILAKSSRLEESASLFFIALTAWITELKDLSTSDSWTSFAKVGDLFKEIRDKGYLEWNSLWLYWRKLTDTFERTIFEDETTEEIYPQIVAFGFALAYECSNLGIIEPAKHMYQALLKHSIAHPDIGLDRMTIAQAHRIYGYLLRSEERWTSSAEELIASGESAMNSGSHSSCFIKLLEVDYVALSPHLKPIAIDESGESLAKKIQNMLSKYRHHNQKLSSRAISSHGDDDHSSTTSGSASRSCNRGETYPRSDSTGRIGHLISMSTARELHLRTMGSTYGDDDHSSTTSGSTSRAITVG